MEPGLTRVGLTKFVLAAAGSDFLDASNSINENLGEYKRLYRVAR